MTDVEQKALALLKKCVGNAIWKHPITRINRQTNLEHEALCRAIEQHEAFRQEVSDAIVDYFGAHLVEEDGGDALASLVIPAPKPDPLVEAMKKAGWADAVIASCAPSLSAALEARGLEIREKNDDQ